MTRQEKPKSDLQDLLSSGGLDLFSPEVRQEVEDLLASGQAVEPETRTQFVTAARRGVRHVRLAQEPIEVVLFRYRQDRGVDLSTIADDAQVTVEILRSVEQGGQRITSLKPDVIAAWADVVNLETSLVEKGLRISLATNAGIPSYSGESVGQLPEADETFVHDVLQALVRRREADGVDT